MGGKDHNTKAEPGIIKRRNRIDGQWSARLIEMLESPAWRVLSLSAHKIIDRVSIELAHHGGNDNGHLPITKEQFVEYGLTPRLVAPAIREAEALGFLRVTEHGRGGNATYRKPNLFLLTCVNSKSGPAPTHDWRKIKTIEQAEAIAAAARAAKNPNAVAIGSRNRNKNRVHKVYLKPGTQSVPENANVPGTQSVPTGSGHKVYPLSISWVGSPKGRAPRYPEAKPTQAYTGYSSLPIELRMLALGLPIPENLAGAA